MTWKPLETRPHHVSGARGDSGADASHRQCRHGWTQTKKTAREGTPEPKKSKRAQPTAGEKSIPNSRERTGTTGDQNTVQLRRSWRFQVWWNEVFPTTQEQCRDSDSPTGSIPDSNGERSCAKQQQRQMIQKEQTNLIGWMEDCQRVLYIQRAWNLFK